MEEEKPEKFLGKFIFTNKTVTYSNKTLQLSNVSKIEMKGFKETTKAKYLISSERKDQAIKIALAGLFLVFLGGYWETFRLIGVVFLIIGGGILWYYYDERRKRKDSIRNYYGLFFDCTSGKTEILWSDKKEFIVQLFDRISNSMNYEQFSSFVASITDNSINITDSKNVVVKSSIDSTGAVNIGDGIL